MTITQRILSLGYELPPVPKPAGSYVPCIRTGGLLFLAGQLPLKDGKLILAGKIGAGGHTIELAQLAARQCALNALAIVAAEAGLDNVVRVVRLGAFVNSAPGFTAQPQVANGASDFLVQVFGDAGKHVRSAVGVNELPLDAAVEIDFVFEVR